jgi:Fe-S-cluster containining protein
MGVGQGKLRFRCTGCEVCCRSLRVPVTLAELRRLVAATGRPPETLVDWLASTEVDMTGEPGSFVVLPSGRRIMVLAWRQGGCGLLKDSGGCQVYAERPLSCQAYPFDLRITHERRLRRVRLVNARDCEFELTGWNEPRAVEQVQERLWREHREYLDQVRAFNRLQALRLRLHKRLHTAQQFFELAGQRQGPAQDA